nr:hypothetical protein [Aliiroseovarius sp. F47248L]
MLDETVLIAAHQKDQAIVSYRLDDLGTAHEVTSLTADEFLPINTPTELVTGHVAGTHYTVVASAGSSSLTVLEVANDGTLRPVDHVIDNKWTRLNSLTEVASVQVEDQLYIVAGGADDGLSLFTLAPGGTLILLDTISDTNSTSLQNIASLTASYVGGKIQIYATSETETGITILNVDPGSIGRSLSGGNGSETLSGTGSNDIISGANGNDTILGLGGDDILLDGSGIDTISGGSGADVFVLTADDMPDTITDFQPGLDRLDLSGYFMLYDMSYVTVQPMSWGAKIIYRNEILDVYREGGGSLNASHFSTQTSLALNRPPSGFQHIPETLNGTELADVLQGNEGTETLNGLGGDDLMLMSPGADVFNGGDGSDTVSYAAGTYGAIVDMLSNNNRGAAAGDIYLSIENIIGTQFDDTLGGDNIANLILGGDGDDIIVGFGGDDTLEGGEGDDVLRGGYGADVLIGGEGFDTADYSDAIQGISVSLLSGITDLGALGDVLSGFEGLTGSIHNDYLAGDQSANVIMGGAGSDIIEGFGGQDVLRGGLGSDQLFGGDDNDNLFGGMGDDVLEGGAGADLLDGGEGQDTADYRRASTGLGVNLQANSATGSAAGDSFLSIENFFGSNHDDEIIGNNEVNHLFGEDGNDTIDGGGGNDLIRGGAGDDVIIGGTGQNLLYGDDGDDLFYSSDCRSLFDGGDGLDTISYASETWRVYVNLASGKGGYSAAGHSYRSIETVIGGPGNDQVIGSLSADTIIGDGGNDILKGFWGNDTLYGDSGYDYLLGGAGHDVLFGGDSSDTLLGQSGNDTLDGGPGGDRLDGGAGWDTLSYASFTQAVGVDIATNRTWGAAHSDKISSFESIIGSSSGDQLFGNGASNTIYGGDGNDLLNGRGGNDALFGQGGDDRMIAGPGRDKYYGGSGQDSVVMTWEHSAARVWLYAGIGGGSMAGDEFHDIEVLHGTRFGDIFYGDSNDNKLHGSRGNDVLRGGQGNDYLAGDADNDWLFGNTGDDFLWGGTGNDHLNSGAGNDVLYGGSGSDTFVFTKGNDRIGDFDANYDTLKITSKLAADSLAADAKPLSYAEITSEGAFFDFGDGNTLLIQGVTSLDVLQDAVLWL